MFHINLKEKVFAIKTVIFAILLPQYYNNNLFQYFIWKYAYCKYLKTEIYFAAICEQNHLAKQSFCSVFKLKNCTVQIWKIYTVQRNVWLQIHFLCARYRNLNAALAVQLICEYIEVLWNRNTLNIKKRIMFFFLNYLIQSC